uniref:Protein-tyrosine-phosphatase n=1 Tax=Attheya septentrionalis TaxID=420275 RepID=A0A7S2UGS4_9STRA
MAGTTSESANAAVGSRVSSYGRLTGSTNPGSDIPPSNNNNNGDDGNGKKTPKVSTPALGSVLSKDTKWWTNWRVPCMAQVRKVSHIVGTKMASNATKQSIQFALGATFVLYVMNQKHLLPKPLAGIVSRALFWPTLPITAASRLGKWTSVVDETVVIGGAPFGFCQFPERLYNELGVRAVINMCDEYRGPIEKYRNLGIEELWLPTVDHFEPSFEDLQRAIEFIEDQEANGNRVYVHCRAGHGRSAAAVLAWMMYTDPGADPEDLNTLLCKKRNVRKTLWKQHNLNEIRSWIQRGLNVEPISTRKTHTEGRYRIQPADAKWQSHVNPARQKIDPNNRDDEADWRNRVDDKQERLAWELEEYASELDWDDYTYDDENAPLNVDEPGEWGVLDKSTLTSLKRDWIDGPLNGFKKAVQNLVNTDDPEGLGEYFSDYFDEPGLYEEYYDTSEDGRDYEMWKQNQRDNNY